MMPKRLTCITPSFACPAGDRYSDAYLSGCLHEVAGSKDMLVQGNLVETGRRVPVPHKRTHESRPEVTNALLPYVSRPVCSGGTCLRMEFSNADPSSVVHHRRTCSWSIEYLSSEKVETNREEQNLECEIRSRPWLSPCTVGKNEKPPFEWPIP